jgi:hypothetical protein
MFSLGNTSSQKPQLVIPNAPHFQAGEEPAFVDCRPTTP